MQQIKTAYTKFPMQKQIRHDTPITSSQDDLLSRSGFAKRVATSLFADGRTKESTVVALCGNWGEGKTSTKNLIQRAAEEQAKSDGKIAPNWVEFAPWQVSGVPMIESLFFEEVGNAIGKAPGKGSPEERVRKWRSFGTAMQKIGTLAGYSGEALSLVLPGAAQIGRLVESSAKKVADVSTLAADSAEASQPSESLSSQKQHLRKLMLELESQIVVVIDDMDRLGDDEILLVLRLIKANADLPNLTYLLLFQRDVVERAIHRRTGEHGATYLEKFVQVFLELPSTNANKIHRSIFDGLNGLIDRLKIPESRFDKERWANLWHWGMRHFFTTMRDVHRYLNVVDFRLAGLVTRGVPEVNILDVFAMECLRLFEPQVHQRVLDQPDLFLKLRKYSERNDSIKIYDELASLATTRRRDATRAILTSVFPAVAGAYSNTEYGSSSKAEWDTQARIASENNFRRFYTGEIDEASVSEADIADLVAAQNDRAKCRQLIRKHLKRSDTAKQFLERLLNEKCFESSDPNLGIRLAVWDSADGFPVDKSDMSYNPALFAYWAFAGALSKANDQEMKRQLVLQTMFGSTGVLAFVWTADGCETRHNNVHFWPQLTEEDVKQIKAEGLKRINACARTGTILRSNHASTLLWAWRRLDSDGARRKVGQWLQKGTQQIVLQLLRTLTSHGTSQEMDSCYVKHRTYIAWNSLDAFAPFHEWQLAVKRIVSARTRKRIPEEIALFRQAEKRKASGKSDWDGRLVDLEDEDQG